MPYNVGYDRPTLRLRRYCQKFRYEQKLHRHPELLDESAFDGQRARFLPAKVVSLPLVSQLQRSRNFTHVVLENQEMVGGGELTTSLLSHFTVASDGKEHLRIGSVELKPPKQGFRVQSCRNNWDEVAVS